MVAITQNNPGMAVRMPRRAIVAVAGRRSPGDTAVETLTESLSALDIETVCLGAVDSAVSIATAVTEEQADAVELCLCDGAPGVPLVRDLLRELIRRDRHDVSIVVHRVPGAPAESG
jgi:methylmalonyl-CoA mutase cobalamin-binding subunit